MAVRASNNAWGTLSTAMSAETTSLTLQSQQSARFPLLVVGGNDWFYITVTDSHGNLEIMKVTATQGDQFTVVRAQDNTTAISFDAGAKVQLDVTVAFWTDFLADMDNVYLNERTFAAPVTLVSDPTTARMAATKQYMDAHFIPKATPMMAPLGYTPVRQMTGNKYFMGYNIAGNVVTMQVDNTSMGFAYTTDNFIAANKAKRGDQCQWNTGVAGASAFSMPSGGTSNALAQIGGPWVMIGYQTFLPLGSFSTMQFAGGFVQMRNRP